MGYMRHHAIVVTSWSGEQILRAHAEAGRLFEDTYARITSITDEAMNGYASFFIAPDGSKEGWNDSDAGDGARAAFVEWLNAQRYEDGSSALAWVEVQFGDDEYETKIVSDSD